MEFAAYANAAKQEADNDRDEGYKTEEEEPEESLKNSDELFRVLSDKIEPEAKFESRLPLHFRWPS